MARTSTKTKPENSNAKSSLGDDAMTLETGTGGTTLVHGLSVDTFSRSVPTHVIPWYVRDSILAAWPGMSGTRVDRSASDVLPWYAYEGTQAVGGSTVHVVESVASRLAVDVAAAEAWGRGEQNNDFGLYADLPLNPATVARWSFWRYDPLAAELDPEMLFEPQMVALDAASQLFTESCAFHFGYLADVDSEYHRLRASGPLGRFDEESAEHEPWYNLYHYWRAVIEDTYLNASNPLVTLPELLRAGNWTIGDVLDELKRQMLTVNGELLPDVFVTAKGYQRGMTGVTLGLQQDAAYLDSDGNSRFYHPYMSQNVNVAGVVATPSTEADVFTQGGDNVWATPGFDALNSVNPTHRAMTYTSRGLDLDMAPFWNAYGSQFTSSTQGYGGTASWAYHLASVPARHAGVSQYTIGNARDGVVFSDFLGIHDLPRGGTLTVDGEAFQYWTGHTINFVHLLRYMQEIGRALEPEVLTTLIAPMGLVGDPAAFMRRPTGTSARMVDELFNLYESGYSFNENPARTYTAAHLGPTNHMLAPGDLSLAGVPLETRRGSETVTARERYWTPASIDDNDATQIAAAFFPGANLDICLYRNIDVQAMAAYDDPQLRELTSRMLGNVVSMRTKVEKPVYLPAGRSGPDTVYASGMGQGAAELVLELIMALHGAAPRYGLGHGGFSDVRMTETGSGSSATYDPITRIEALTSSSTTPVVGGGTAYSIDGTVFMGRALSRDADVYSRLVMGGQVDLADFDATGGVGAHVPSLGQTLSMLTTRFGTEEVARYHAANPGVGRQGIPPASDVMVGRLPRAFVGSAPLPVSTVHQSKMAMPEQFSYGLLGTSATTISVPGDILFDPASPGAQLGSPGQNMFYAVYNAFIAPTNVTFTDSNGTEFVVPAVDAATRIVYNNASATANAMAAGELVPAFRSMTDGACIDGGDSYATALGVTTGTGWSSPLIVAQAAGFTHPNAAALLDVHTPTVSIMDVIQSAWASHVAVAGGDEADLTDFEVSVDIEMFVGLGSNYGAAQTHAWTPNTANLGQSTAIAALANGMPVGRLAGRTLNFTVDTASAAQMNDLFDGVTMESVASSTGRNSLSHTLELMHEEGMQLVFQGTSAIGGGVAMPMGFPATQGTTIGVKGVQVHSIDPRSPRATAGCEWSDPVMRVRYNRADSIYRSAPSWAQNVAVPNVAGAYGWMQGTKNYLNIAAQAGGTVVQNNPIGTVVDVSIRDVNRVAYHSPAAVLLGGLVIEPSAATIAAGTSRSPLHDDLYTVAGGSGLSSGLTFVYPDDPRHKMVYRPWRRIADASILKELRMLFANDGEDLHFEAGPLGIKVIGTAGQFRFADLLDAGQPDTFILELATSKTRLVSPSHRSVLTFTKLALLDPQTMRHAIPDVLDDLSQTLTVAGMAHKSSATGTTVLTRDLIRDLQLGRQFQNL